MATTQQPTPVIPFPGRPRPAVDLRIHDPAQQAKTLGPARFSISGRVSADAVAPRLDASFDRDTRDIALCAGMTPMATFLALERALPPGFLATARATGTPADADVHLAIHRSLAPAAPLPAVTARIDDPAQSAAPLSVNSFEIRAVATNGGVIQSSAEITVDGTALRLLITRGMTPLATARALERRLPKGYRANISQTGTLTAPSVAVTILRDSVLNEAAA